MVLNGRVFLASFCVSAMVCALLWHPNAMGYTQNEYIDFPTINWHVQPSMSNILDNNNAVVSWFMPDSWLLICWLMVVHYFSTRKKSPPILPGLCYEWFDLASHFYSALGREIAFICWQMKCITVVFSSEVGTTWVLPTSGVLVHRQRCTRIQPSVLYVLPMGFFECTVLPHLLGQLLEQKAKYVWITERSGQPRWINTRNISDVRLCPDNWGCR